VTAKPAIHKLIRPLEGYRALAIIAVLVFHLDEHLLPGGYLGVDLFFVISGFIITKGLMSSKEAGTLSLARFYARRFRRLFPALLVTTIVSLIAAWFIFDPSGFAAMGKSALFSIFSLANINFWLDSGYFAADSSTKPLLHMWSLSVEEQFYLFWPLVFLFFTRHLSRIAAVCLFTVSLGATIFISNTHPETAFFWFPFRVYEFMGGAMISLYGWRIQNNALATISLLIGLVLFVVACFVFNENSNIALTGGLTVLACMLLLLSMNAKLGEVLLGNAVMVWIGQRSYSIYLVHWPIIVLYVLANGELSTVEVVALGALSFVLGTVLKWLIEDPFRQSRSPRSLSARQAYPPIITTALVAICASTIVWGYKGFPGRIDGSLDTLIAQDARYDEFIKRGTCFVMQSQTANELPKSCYVPDEDRRNMLLIGNSHAADLRRGLDVGFPDWSIKQITNSGCPPFMGKSNRPTCTNIRELIYTDVLENYDYDLVVIAGVHNKGARSAQAIQAFMEKRKIDYVFIGPRPNFKTHPRTLIANYGSLDGLNAEMTSHINIPEELSFNLADRHYFSSIEAFCENGNDCIWQIKGQRVYRDTHHIFPIGSELFGKKFANWYADRPEKASK